MLIPRLEVRLTLVAPLAFAAAMSPALSPREASAQPGSGSAPMSVSVTVVRGCLIDTGDPTHPAGQSASSGQPSGAGVNVSLTCSQKAVAFPPQPPGVATTLSAGDSPNATHAVTRMPDGRVVIQF
jgi:hypothetical protein